MATGRNKDDESLIHGGDKVQVLIQVLLVVRGGGSGPSHTPICRFCRFIAPARLCSAMTFRGVSAKSGIGSMRSLRTAPSTTSSTCPCRLHSTAWSCSWPSGGAARGTGGVHQVTPWGRGEACRRRDVAGEDGEADELAVQGHDAHDALLRT